ncbi:hypothetical protein GCM10007049_27650 [Echinicola pacifica]|uniref:N-acetyltransferase domain-containing protein n=1 Tax=Echinicola pacifica TaxID=346377 RepID=A0A918Q6R9_9BACT|nr:GNAT family N-acetyltransferase [Echinicola pacifica]GGZ32609.1 hypothetical protein GCM10007049_27650 [Echinicola pacifica]
MLKLRAASILDLKLLRLWDTKQHIIDCDPDSDWNWEIELKRQPVWREQLMIVLNGNAIGMIQIIDPYEEETHYWGEIAQSKRAIDIWIGEEEYLSQGYGTIAMGLAIARCFQQPEITGILVDPLKNNINAHRFYERLGFEFLEERIFEGLECYVYELKKPL